MCTLSLTTRSKKSKCTLFYKKETYHDRTIHNWQKLLDSIPASWRNIIALGNQQFNNNEFFATIIDKQRNKGEIGDVYEFVDGKLRYYRMDDQSNLIATHLWGDPGTYIQGWTEPFPDLNELKRIYVSNPQMPNIKAISFMLPHRGDIKLKKLPYAYRESRAV